MLFAGMVMEDGLKAYSTIETLVVPLPGQDTSCTVVVDVAVKLTAAIFAPAIVCELLAGANVNPARLGVIV